MEPVVVIKAEQYNQEEITKAVEQLLHHLGAARLVRPGMRVTVKPNLLMKRQPEEATTTHPIVMQAVIHCLQQLGAGEITIADSPGGPYSKALLQGIYQASGMEQAAKETGALLNYDLTYETVAAPQGKKCTSFHIISPVAKADLVVSVGKVKTHCMTTLSGGVKNLFGCIPGLQKPELHYRFPQKEEFGEMLVDLAQTVAPALTIMDGVVAMEGDGPSAGSPVKTGFLCGSTSPFALDAFLCRLLGMDSTKVPTVAAAQARGLAPGEREVINLGGVPERIPLKQPSSHSVDFISHVPGPLQGTAAWLRDHALTPRPAVEKRRCIGCGRCAQSCPAKIIKITGGKAVVPKEGCIRCYCCHEMCPVKAIHVRRVKLFDL